MTIPDNPIPPEEEQPENIISGKNSFPLMENEQEEDYVIPISYENSIVSSEVPLLEDPVGETAELPAIVDSTYTDLDEPGELGAGMVPKKQPKPAYIAILTIIGLLMLCCIMAGVMFLLLRQEIFATGL